MRIKDVLKGKGDGAAIVTVRPDTSVHDLIALLAEHNIGAVIVSTDDNPVAGIVSERDIVRCLVSGVQALEGDVSTIMTSNVRSAKPDDSVDDLMKLMTEHRIRHVPVLTDEGLHGIVSIGDVVKTRIGELEFERDQLTSYVSNAQ